MALLASVDERGRNRALPIGNKTNTLHADLGAIVQKASNDFLVDDAAVVLLQHRVAIVAAVIAGASQRHINGDWRDALAAFPGADPLVVPGDLGAVED